MSSIFFQKIVPISTKLGLVFCCFAATNFLLNQCAADPDSPGFCELDCSSTKIASDDFSISFIGIEDGTSTNLSCLDTAAGQPYFKEVPIRFTFRKPFNKPQSSVFNREQNADTAVTTETQPISNISYEVSVVAGRGAGNNPDDPSGKYQGILTSQGEWCTDTCGVGSIDLLPICHSKEYDFNVLVRSGNVGGMVKFKVTP